MFQPSRKLSLVEIAVAVCVDPVAVLFVVSPLSPVEAAIDEAVHPLAVEGVVPPLALIILRLHVTRHKFALTPSTLCYRLTIY